MSRCVVNVSTGRYVIGQKRLRRALAEFSPASALAFWRDKLPTGSPTHQELNYAFKGHALEHARRTHDVLLWCDASILPIRDLEPLWKRIEEHGYWISDNGYWNSEWTAMNTLPLLGVSTEENERIPHLATTAFGIDLRQEIGRKFADEFFRLAKNGSFHGPWVGGPGVQHRHDQTAASVIAYRLKMKPTYPPRWFAYKGGETVETILMAHGIC